MPAVRSLLEPGVAAAARRHLARRDPILKRVMAAVGPCTMKPDPDGFFVLSRAIVGQLISTKAAQTIYGRLQAAMAPEGVVPARLRAASEETLRGVGLSRSKTR